MSESTPVPEQLVTQIRSLTPGQAAALANHFTPRQLIELIKAHQHRDSVLCEINAVRNEVMVPLINAHNPYTSNETNDMSIFVGNPNPDNNDHNHIAQVEVEVDGPYSMPMEWNFKGSPQKINKTVRMKYRYRARNLDLNNRPLLNPHHWVSAYLLIGYEDGGI